MEKIKAKYPIKKENEVVKDANGKIQYHEVTAQYNYGTNLDEVLKMVTPEVVYIRYKANVKGLVQTFIRNAHEAVLTLE